VTTQDDRYDRQIEGASRPTARNTGLYSQYVPLQRFSMYVNNYLAVVRTMSAQGNNDVNPTTGEPFSIDKMEDEMAVLLAAMAHDTEAFLAAAELFNSDEISNKNKADLYDMVTAVYGEGSFTLDEENVYSDEVNALRIPKVPMDPKASDDWRKTAIAEFGETMDSRLADEGVAGSDQDFYSKAGITVSGAASLIDRAAEAMGGDVMDDDPNFTDLFDFTLSTSSAPNVNTFWQQAANAGDQMLPMLTDLIVGAAFGAAIGFAGAGTALGRIPGLSKMGSASGDMLEPAMGGGIMGAPAPGGPGALAEMGKLGGRGWAARARLAAPYFGASVASLNYSAWLGQNETSESMMMSGQSGALQTIYDIGRQRQTEEREQESIDKGTTRGTRLKPQPQISDVDVRDETYGRVN